MSNPFLAFEEANTPAPVKARKAAAEKAAATRAAKKPDDAAEQDELAKRYRAWKREQREDLLSGIHGDKVRELLNWSARMSLTDAPEMIRRVQVAMLWIEDLDTNARFVLLRLLNNAIVNLRLREGLAPIDDQLFDEPPKAFFKIKSFLGLDGK